MLICEAQARLILIHTLHDQSLFYYDKVQEEKKNATVCRTIIDGLMA
jgi:hypothetical protein